MDTSLQTIDPTPQRVDPKIERARKAGAHFIRKYRFDPNSFARDVLRVKLDPWQEEANEKIADYVRYMYQQPLANAQGVYPPKSYFTVRAMHGPGKTFWLGSVIYWFGATFPKSRIPCMAPKADQLKTRLWLELHKLRASSTADFQRITQDIGSMHLRFFGQQDWTAFGQTAKHSENLSGLHNDHQLIVVDEASGVPEALWPTIFGALSTGAIQILVMISNPTKNVGTFAQSWLKKSVSADYCKIKIELDKAPRVKQAWVDQMIRKYGRQSPIVKIRCFGEFSESGENQLIPLEHINDCLIREPRAEDGSHRKVRISVDVADGGLNETVITGMSHYYSFCRLEKVKRYSFPKAESPIKAAEAAIAMFEALGGKKGVDDFVVDVMGVGSGTAGYLIKEGHAVILFQGGQQSANPKRWRNRRVQGYFSLVDLFQEGKIDIAEGAFEDEEDADEFSAQLCSIERKPNGDKIEDLKTKDEMKMDGQQSPDIADSFMQQFSTIAPQIGESTQSSANEGQDTVIIIPSRVLEGMHRG